MGDSILRDRHCFQLFCVFVDYRLLCPQIVLSLTLESVDGSDFFNEDKIIENLAALLDVPKDKIKIAKIVAEGD